MKTPVITTLADYLLDRSLPLETRGSYLLSLGFRDFERSDYNLKLLAGDPPGVFSFLELGEALVTAVCQAADPDASLSNFERFSEAFGGKLTLFRYLQDDPRALEVLAQLFGFSQFLSEILILNPEYFDLVTNLESLSQSQSAEELARDLTHSMAALHSRDLRLDTMRRFKRREILRIGLRDMLHLADLPAIVRDTSHLADALVEAAFRLSVQTAYNLPPDSFMQGTQAPISVFALGKLGGEELNYSSDIDLLFVAGIAEDRTLMRVAEQTIQNLAQSTGEGYLYRVDMRLRPQGSSGPLAPSIDYCLSYYESWAEPWEMQALIKARQITGDRQLGTRFSRFVEGLVYAKQVDISAITEIQHVKKRMENRLSHNSEDKMNVKLGRGGIRDVEFTVQLLQLLTGADHPELRTGNTLDALQRLKDLGRIAEVEAMKLQEAYCYLRRLENYLQIVDEFPLHSLPEDREALNRLARRMGYRGNEPGARLEAELQQLTDAVRVTHERYFYPEAADLSGEEASQLELILSEDQPDSLCKDFFEGYGLGDPVRARENLRLLALGPAHVHVPLRTRRLFLQIAPAIMRAVSLSPDPDGALNQLESLSSAVGNRASFFLSLSRNPQVVEALAMLASISEPMMQILLTHPEFFDALMAPEIMTSEKTMTGMLEELQSRMAVEIQRESRLNALRRYRHREMLRIAVRDLTGSADVLAVHREISALAEACLRAAYQVAVDDTKHLPFSSLGIIGLGKLGGRELHYASDLDIAFVYRPLERTTGEFRPFQLTSFCDRLIQALSEITAEGWAFKVDTRLRPEGGTGALARTLESYEEYWKDWMEPWERLALLRARFVAGDESLSELFLHRAQDLNFCKPVDLEVLEGLRHVKQRVETERTDSESDSLDIKLGPGGLSDIEFTAQWLQLKHGRDIPDLRIPTTLGSLQRLHKHRVLTEEEFSVLREAYLFLCRLEARLRVMEANAPPLLPRSGKRLEVLARSLGYHAEDSTAGERLLKNHARQAGQVREVFLRRFCGGTE